MKPLYKNHLVLHEDLSSYCPISNLNSSSKIIKRIIHTWLQYHLKTFPSLSPFQPAYRPFHSTETPLLHIQNYLFLSMDSKKISALVLIHFSNAFDSLITKFFYFDSSYFGISGLALKLQMAYLQNKIQAVSIGSQLSPPSLHFTGVS